jgi:hypothetical protein
MHTLIVKGSPFDATLSANRYGIPLSVKVVLPNETVALTPCDDIRLHYWFAGRHEQCLPEVGYPPGTLLGFNEH